MKYLRGLVVTHKLFQISRMMVKSSGLKLTLNELLILATIGDEKKEVREVSWELMIDKATVVRTLGKLRENGMVARVEIDSTVYYMLSNTAINFMGSLREDSDDTLERMGTEEREKVINCMESMEEAVDFLRKYLVED